jgi:DNA-binding beta-propeller fold protein YncE
MYRLVYILFAFAIPVVGMTQTCIESEDEFVYDNLLISSITTCEPTVLYTELTICELAYISVDLSSVDFGSQTLFDPDKLIVDIRQPGSSCFVRFASAALPGGLQSLDLCTSYPIEGLIFQACDPYAPIAWPTSQQYLFNIDTSVFTSNLSGFWVVSLSYLDSDIFINTITLDFVGSCCLDVNGCTYSNACNYDPNANIDDNSCEFTSCAGCIDQTACNFDSTATISNGYCTYPDEFLDCNDICLHDANFNGICDELEILGCTDPTNPGYNPDANVDDGSCIIIVTGCTYTDACNYDPLATSDDGHCIFMNGLLTFQILTDNYPGETTWSVSNANGMVVVNGGPYSDPNTLYEDEICLEVGCYTLTINDSYGDGLCCAYGIGSYSLIWNSNILVTGGQFGDSETQSVCIGTQGCTYPNACNYNAAALEDDGTCEYPSDIDACDCLGNQPDALGVCGGNCLNDLDGDGVCDNADDCIGIVDECGVCNGPGAIYDCGCDSFPEGVCDCSGTPCSLTTQLLQIDNPFLELSYVQNATPFISLYDGWCDADFVKIGICRPNAILDPSEFLSGAASDFVISITFEDSWIGVLDFSVPATEQLNFEFTLELSAVANTPTTASQIVSVILKDDSGNTLDYLYQDEVSLPNVTLNGIYNAPGQHRIVRQPWVLQGNTEIIESEWLVCDENSSLSFYSSWNLESITQVPLDPISQACLNDLNDDGICDQLELPVFCQNVNATNYSPLQNTLICDEAEVLEYWISSFNIPEIAQQGGVLPPLASGQQPVSTAMVSNDLCFSSASQLAYCNVGQRAFVVDEYNQSIRIIDYGDLTDPAMIPDGLGGGGFLSISADNMSTELANAGVPDYESLVPSDIDIFNVVGPDDTTYCCSTMVAVAWIDTLNLISSGWVTLHDIDGGLLPTDAIQEVGPTPRSLAFSQDGNWLVVACSGEGEHETTDPMAEIVCFEVDEYTQGTGDQVVKHTFTFQNGDHIVSGSLSITGAESRTSALVYDGTDDLSHMLEPSHVAITPDSKRAFVNCQVNNTLVEVNLEKVLSNDDVITGAYGFGTRNMGTGSGFDGKDDGQANLQVPSATILGWYQPGDIEIAVSGLKMILLTANEGMPSLNGLGEEDVTLSNISDYSGLQLDSEYGYGYNGAGDSYVFGSRSFALWEITSSGSLTYLYDSESLIEETLAELMPEYANSVKSTYDSGDSASVSRGPEPSGIAFGTLKEQEILIVSLEGMGGSMIFDLIDWDVPSSVSASYQAYATNRDFQTPGMNQCLYNNLGAKDVLFLHSTVTDNTSVYEGYESILVSNDVTGSLSLFRLDSNLKIPGCTDTCACNYNDNATFNDGSCDFDSCVYPGCMYPDADNYDPAMTLDDGSCVFTNDCPADLNGDNIVATGDLLIFLSLYGTPCP